MAEAQIKAKLVLDTSGMKATAAGIGGGAKATTDTFSKGLRGALEGLDLPILGDIGAVMAGAVLVLETIAGAIKKGFDFLQKASPLLASSMMLLRRSFEILLRPIGDAIGLFLKPFAIAMLKFAIPIYKKWREFLQQTGAKESLTQIGEGAGKVAEGIINLDFSQVKEGLGEVWQGINNLMSGFLSFMGGGISDFGSSIIKFIQDGWAFFVEVFSPILSWIGEKVESGLSWAWEKFWDFLIGITPDSWTKRLEGLKGGFESIWDFFGEYLIILGESWWAGPLAPFFAAIQTGWQEIVSPMVDMLITALDEKLPGLRAALDFLFSADEQKGEEKGFIGKMLDNLTEIDNIIVTLVNPALGLLYTVAETVFGKSEDDKGASVIGSVNKTITAFNNSTLAIDATTSALNSVPRNITTIHTIETRYVTSGAATTKKR